ncbi:hypothetical protein [Chromobacterium sp. CV08]
MAKLPVEGDPDPVQLAVCTPGQVTVIAWTGHFCKNARQMFYAMHII